MCRLGSELAEPSDRAGRVTPWAREQPSEPSTGFPAAGTGLATWVRMASDGPGCSAPRPTLGHGCRPSRPISYARAGGHPRTAGERSGATQTTTSPATTSGRAPGPSTAACGASTSLTTGARWRSGTSLRRRSAHGTPRQPRRPALQRWRWPTDCCARSSVWPLMTRSSLRTPAGSAMRALRRRRGRHEH